MWKVKESISDNKYCLKLMIDNQSNNKVIILATHIIDLRISLGYNKVSQPDRKEKYKILH